jgi:hypothetical protein
MNIQSAVLAIAVAVGWSASSTDASESPYSLSITFIGWTNSLGATADIQRKFDIANGPRISAPPGDWAILAVTNHGKDHLHFDSVAVEYERSEGQWLGIMPKQWPGLHGVGLRPGAGVTTYLLCPEQVPHESRWRVRYVCDIDRDPSQHPLKGRLEHGQSVVAPELMVSPVLPPVPNPGESISRK